jgi:hypothetical protein
MDTTTPLLAHLAACERVVRDGEEVIPAWRITTADGIYLILTRFDHDKPEQSARLFGLMRGFMRWRQATAFIVGIEVWVGPEVRREGEEAICAIEVSRAGVQAVMKRIGREGVAATFGEVEPLSTDQIDPMFAALLPGKVEAMAPGEIEELAAIFSEGGELPAQRLS